MPPNSNLQSAAYKTYNQPMSRTNIYPRYIFIRRFRMIADRMTAKAERMGIRSEQDVFDRVS